jgi:hypothetical protein
MGGVAREANSKFELGVDTFQYHVHLFLSARFIVVNHRAVRVGGDDVCSNGFSNLASLRLFCV